MRWMTQTAIEVSPLEQRAQQRKPVCLRAIVADKGGLSTAEMRDLSERGCRLAIFKALDPRQYLTMRVYAEDESTALQIDLARVRWTGRQTAGVQFLSLSPINKIRLARLCGDSDD